MLDGRSPQNSGVTADVTAPGRPFQRGISGNPGGRPKLPDDVKALAKAKSKRAFERIVELIESEDERVAFMASKEVIDRAYGKTKSADDDGAGAKNVTINIVRLADQKPETKVIEAATIDAPAATVQVRKLADD